MTKLFIIFSFLSLSIFNSCGQNLPSTQSVDNTEKISLKNKEGNTIQTRFNTPSGFERIDIDKNSFAYYLRTLPLKPDGAEVNIYDGSVKPNNNIYEAVVNLGIGKRDLHQCADAVMRLRAEFLFYQKRYDDIHFNFTNGFRVDYSKWMQGYRIVVNGNKTYWMKKASPSTSYASFWKYLEMIFSYAGTASLSKEMKSVSIKEMKIGDVFIKGGFPGHAIIVVDMAENKTTGEKLFMLAQSYMPAQELQLLTNRSDIQFSPWYSSSFKNTLITPEWKFNISQLKRFE